MRYYLDEGHSVKAIRLKVGKRSYNWSLWPFILKPQGNLKIETTDLRDARTPKHGEIEFGQNYMYNFQSNLCNGTRATTFDRAKCM